MSILGGKLNLSQQSVDRAADAIAAASGAVVGATWLSQANDVVTLIATAAAAFAAVAAGLYHIGRWRSDRAERKRKKEAAERELLDLLQKRGDSHGSDGTED